MEEERHSIAIPQMSLIALFVTALITAHVTAPKVVEIRLPFGVPITEDR